MKPREKTLIFFDDFIKTMGLDYMIFASSLLGIIRGGELLEHDAEIDVCVIGEDITNKIMDNIKASGHFMGEYACSEKFGETYIAKDGVRTSEKGWIAISPLWEKNGIGFVNMVDEDCITMDAINHDKKTWGTLKYLGRTFNCPKNPKKWLEKWYGEDWMTPNDSHWKDNTNRKNWGEI